MTEQEEFELVAKAAGYDFNWMTSYSDGNSYIWSEAGTWVAWNPKTDDGDCLRLSVDLEMDVHIDRGLVGAKSEFAERVYYFKDHRDNYAAVRAAVWDVAVEVAKRRMKK